MALRAALCPVAGFRITYVWGPNDLGRHPAACRPARPGASGPPRNRLELGEGRAQSRPSTKYTRSQPSIGWVCRAARYGRPIQVQDEAEPVGPAFATKPLGVLVHVRLRVVQVLGEAALLAGVTSARHREPHEPRRRHRRPGPQRWASRRSGPTAPLRRSASRIVPRWPADSHGLQPEAHLQEARSKVPKGSRTPLHVSDQAATAPLASRSDLSIEPGSEADAGNDARQLLRWIGTRAHRDRSFRCSAPASAAEQRNRPFSERCDPVYGMKQLVRVRPGPEEQDRAAEGEPGPRVGSKFVAMILRGRLARRMSKRSLPGRCEGTGVTPPLPLPPPSGEAAAERG